VIDSTKLTDWLKSLHELFINVRVRSGDALFPVHAQLTSSEVVFVKGVPEGRRIMLGDGAFDAKPVLNAIVSRGYGARIRDGAYDESIYAYRGVGEGVFGALTVEFGTGRRLGGRNLQKLEHS
jgi:hypothetical protein